MARKRVVSESRKKLIQDFLLEFQPKDARDIQDHIKEIYAFDASPILISKITDKMLPIVH